MVTFRQLIAWFLFLQCDCKNLILKYENDLLIECSAFKMLMSVNMVQ